LRSRGVEGHSFIVGICTEDFSLVFDLVRLMNERGIGYVLLAPGEVVERRVDVAILDAPSPRFAVQFPKRMRPLKDPEMTMDRAVALAYGVFGPRNMVMGIDPGLRNGVAVLADGVTIGTHVLLDPSAIPAMLRSALTALRPRTTTVRIGDGDPVRRDQIIGSLFDRFGSGICLEMVDERSTSIEPRRTHEEAAARIARMKGRCIDRRDYPSRGRMGEGFRIKNR